MYSENFLASPVIWTILHCEVFSGSEFSPVLLMVTRSQIGGVVKFYAHLLQSLIVHGELAKLERRSLGMRERYACFAQALAAYLYRMNWGDHLLFLQQPIVIETATTGEVWQFVRLDRQSK
jgi:hypothetical protein